MGFPYMLVGYMRVSSESDRQNTNLQRDALQAAGVDVRHLYEDRASGSKDDRPGLAQALEFLRPGDVLVVWKLDRLGRSLPHLLSIVNTLKDKQVAFRGCVALLIRRRNFPGKELGCLKLDGPVLPAHKIGRRTTSHRFR